MLLLQSPSRITLALLLGLLLCSKNHNSHPTDSLPLGSRRRRQHDSGHQAPFPRAIATAATTTARAQGFRCLLCRRHSLIPIVSFRFLFRSLSSPGRLGLTDRDGRGRRRVLRGVRVCGFVGWLGALLAIARLLPRCCRCSIVPQNSEYIAAMQ